MKKIPITKGKYAIVDDEDYHYLSRFKWQFVNDASSLGMDRACRTINIEGKHINILMEYFILPNKKQCVFYHRNRNTLDNRKENLCSIRIGITRHASKKCRDLTIKHSSRFKGVSWNRRKDRWDCRLYAEGKRYFRGYFKREKDAARAYNKKAKELYGEFAYQNEII
jgi:hypothetical protein